MNGQFWKESLNSDSHHFHQYQQSEQSPLILAYWTQTMATTYDVGNPAPDLGQVHNCDGVNVIPALLSW